MKNENYHSSITASITAQQAFKAICQVTKWWATRIEGKTENLNDVFTMRSGETFVTFTIEECVADKKIVWHVIDCYLSWLKDKTEWKNTDVVFEILDKGNSTQINFTHIGLVPEVECYNACVKGWDQYFKGSLLTLLTTGKGQPN